MALANTVGFGHPSLDRVANALANTPHLVVHRDPEIMGGTPVFVGTRVPVDTLVDYLAGGDSIEVVLDQFPTVSRVQALAALELLRDTLKAKADARPAR